MSATTAQGLGEELRPSSRPVIAMLVVVAAALGLVARALPFERRTACAVLLYALAAAAWLLDGWRPLPGRWLTVIAAMAAVHLLDRWLAAPGSLALIGVPVGVAAALIGLSAAAVVALGQSVLLLWGAPGGTAVGGFALAGIWATLGLMVAVYHPVYQATSWWCQESQRVRSLLEEARDRRAELRQALADLADANLQLTRLNRLALGLRQAAEEARRAKEQFVANVSHELRTPLNMIIGFSEMIVQAPQAYAGKVPRALLADLDVILRNSQHLLGLIDDVLDLSQIEAGQMALIKEHVALAEIIEAAATAVRPLYSTKGLYLDIEVPPDLPPILCDRTRIREVLLNLLSNAGRFTEQGGVRVRAWREGSDVMVSVVDTGPGIAAEDMGRIFRPFQQLDGSLRRRHGGSGLGLAISKSFVELHGGRMWLESEKGLGTTFYFRLPIDAPLPADSSVARWFSSFWHYDERTRRSLAPAPHVRPRFVLLEAGDSLERLLTRYLDHAEIVPVASLEQAWQELATVPAQALLVNGASVSEALQQVLCTSLLPYGTPAIICSVPGASEAAGALGAADYLIKPVSRDELLAALDRLQPKGGTILVVDDEPEAQQLFRRILSSAGRDYRVLRASDGRQALKILHRERPDVLLVDLVMPEMDGFQLLAAKNEDPALRDIPAVVISARDPAGQPILSNALAVTRGGGLSTVQLLNCIEAISRILGTMREVEDVKRKE